LNIAAEFVTSAADAAGFPGESLPEVAFVGRSNVGKSSLINALARKAIARTSGTPCKTRLVNFYRIARGSGPPLFLVDLPGYGFARGKKEAVTTFDALASDYFGGGGRTALVLVDMRHPGLENDRATWQWIRRTAVDAAIVATKIDKLARGERIRAMRQLESVFEDSVLPVSAVTGEGLDELWKLIDRLANNSSPRDSRRPTSRMAPPPRRPPTSPRKR